MKIVVIDYGSGNLKSVVNTLNLIKESGDEIIVSNNKDDLKIASHIILPGVGNFKDCILSLKKYEGYIEELRNQVLKIQKPFLGICVGMQVLSSVGFEDGENNGLGFIDGKVIKITKKDGFKIPQMGWNSLKINYNHPILKDVESGADVYFANSYHFKCQNQNNILATVDYSEEINAILLKKNIVGIQFHPEKSGEVGLKILKNFLDWRF